MGLPHHSLIIDCATRWNSTYEMFDRLIEQRLAVYAVLHSNVVKDSQAKVLDITDKDWEVIQDIVPVLQPLYIATRGLCSEQYPTLSGVMPIVYSLLEIHLKTKDSDSNVVKNFKVEISQDLKRRFNTETEDMCKNIRMMCSFMDPRYKELPFLTPAQRDVVHREIICYCQKLAQPESQVTGVAADRSVPQHQSAEVNSSTKPGSKLSQDDMAYFLGDFYEQDCSVVVPESPEAELELLYLEQKPIPCKESPFACWRNEQSSYPTMSKLARTLLSIPGTSVPSGRCYDGAAVMSGHISDIQERFRREVSQAMYVHCYAHMLNIVLVDCVHNVQAAAEFFVTIQKLYKFFSTLVGHE
ncbi:E3 SUMO-protein ligase ZBED1-like [Tachypleus tridentatus]|uniref:E3 SUMO-protein ligase ZBED1-like n=1 Tax=Tachypleus tridentatus TaxID=6853 RepID=UPI003FCF96D5